MGTRSAREEIAYEYGKIRKFGKEGVDTVVLLGMEFVSFGAFLLARSPISRNRKEREDFGTISDSLKFDSKI